MKKSIVGKGIVLGIIVLFVGASVIPSTGSIALENYSQPDTVYVDDDFNESTPGWGYDHFDKIQDGVDAVNESGTVYVYNGTYYENVVIDKTINLIGEDRNTTIVDGSNNSDTIRITTDYVNISKISMTNSSYAAWNNGGLEITYASNCTIKNCSFFNNGYAGIRLYDVHYTNFSNCEVYNNTEGIFMEYSSNIQIINCICYNISGIRVDHYSHHVNIVNCTTYNNGNGILLIQGANNNNIINCVSHHNIYTGIYFYDGWDGIPPWNNNVINCALYDNEMGIKFNSANDNMVLSSSIYNNTLYGVQIVGLSNDNLIYHNNFINNDQNAYDNGTNTWHNATFQKGNYWSDFDEPSEGAWDNNSNGIVDSPYDIPGDSNQDLYPLMHPFELYYILNISAPPEVNEGELFNVVVKSIGGTAIPNATVDFNDELKLTDIDGRVYFTAPQVGADAYYDIIATKEGYTSDTKQILVKDVPVLFNFAFIFGRLDNLTTSGEVITFEALNIRAITFFPFTFNHYTSGELLTISKYYFGLVGARFIFAFCGMTYQPSKISMNIFDRDNSTNTIIWLVSEVEGNTLRTKDVETMLLNESGVPQPDAEITFNEVTGEGYINPGDTFTVVAPSDGNYVFLLIHELTGATIFKSALTHY